MLTEPTVERMMMLHLEAMAGAWLEQQKNPEANKLAFDERLAFLVEAQWNANENKRYERAKSEAKLRISTASIEGVDFPVKRQLDRALIRQLATCRWIVEHQNVTITGSTGTGKTYVACALAHHACRRGYRALYRRASRLFQELVLARADGTYARMLARIARFDVLVIDDFAIAPIDEYQRQDLLEILEDRSGTRSTVMTSQLPVGNWHAYINEPTVADAICDRLLHNNHAVVLKGPSRRPELEAKEEENAAATKKK
jgi:DNA replication protein DnaC